MKAYEYDGDGRDNCARDPDPRRPRRRRPRSTARSSWTRSPRSPTRSWSATSRARRSPTRRSSPRSRRAPTTAASSRSSAASRPRNLGTNRLLDAIVEDLPSPGQARRPRAARDHARARRGQASCSPTSSRRKADPFAGRINFFRVYQGVMRPDTQVLNTRAHAKERIGQLLVLRGQGARATPTRFGPGDIGAVAKLKETRAGDWLADRDEPIAMPAIELPQPVMAFAMEPKAKGDEDKVFTVAAPPAGGGPDDRPAPRPADRRPDRRRALADPRRGDRRPAEVALRRRGRRSSRRACPTRRRSAAPAKAHGRHKKQTGGRGQFGDCHIEIEPLDGRRTSSSSTRSRAA